MSEPRAPRALFALATLLPLAGLLAVWLDLRGRTDAIAKQLAAAAEAQERVERAVQLFRFERGSKGLGVAALIEQLRFWAPPLGLSTTSQHELPRIQQRVEDVLTAFADIGPDAFGPLRRAFAEAEPGKDDELIRWILEAMSRVDQEQTEDLLVQCIRGFEVPVSQRIRVVAAQRLLELDKARTAEVLSQVVDYESASGIDGHRLPPDLQQKLAASKTVPQPLRAFFNFVDILVLSEATALEDKLIMIARRPDQDRMTVQTCVKHLGEMGSTRAVKTIKQLFESPPELTINPIFQNQCLDAIAKIEGAAACDWFREVLRRKPEEIVVGKLQDLIKRYCP